MAPGAARAFWSQDRGLFGEIRSEFENIVETSDHVMLEWTRTGTTTDGAPVRFDGVSVLDL